MVIKRKELLMKITLKIIIIKKIFIKNDLIFRHQLPYICCKACKSLILGEPG